MMQPLSMAGDELGFLCHILGDEELAREVAGADAPTGARLLLKANNRLLAIMLWRHRTGANLNSAVDAIVAIERELEL